MFVATTLTDPYHVGEHPNTLTYACKAGSKSYKGGIKRDEEVIKIPLL